MILYLFYYCYYYFYLGFTLHKVEKPLQDMELQKKKHKKINAYMKSLQQELTVRRVSANSRGKAI